MKTRWLVALLGLALVLPMLGGCETLKDTPGENYNRMVRAQDTNLKQVPMDVEYLLLLDRPITLTEMPVPSR